MNVKTNLYFKEVFVEFCFFLLCKRASGGSSEKTACKNASINVQVVMVLVNMDASKGIQDTSAKTMTLTLAIH